MFAIDNRKKQADAKDHETVGCLCHECHAEADADQKDVERLELHLHITILICKPSVYRKDRIHRKRQNMDFGYVQAKSKKPDTERRQNTGNYSCLRVLFMQEMPFECQRRKNNHTADKKWSQPAV